jgi:hypothetical protein
MPQTMPPSTDRAARSTSLGDELKLIPSWAIFLASVLFLFIQIAFNVWIPQQKNPPPEPVRILLGLFVGALVGCIVMLIGYVNRDAGRRGMNRTLWTLLVIFVPNALGFILYFLLRQPMIQPCPRCGAEVQAGFNYCPKCNLKLHPHCAQCQRTVNLSDVYCPYCGYKLDDIVH